MSFPANALGPRRRAFRLFGGAGPRRFRAERRWVGVGPVPRRLAKRRSAKSRSNTIQQVFPARDRTLGKALCPGETAGPEGRDVHSSDGTGDAQAPEERNVVRLPLLITLRWSLRNAGHRSATNIAALRASAPKCQCAPRHPTSNQILTTVGEESCVSMAGLRGVQGRFRFWAAFHSSVIRPESERKC